MKEKKWIQDQRQYKQRSQLTNSTSQILFCLHWSLNFCFLPFPISTQYPCNFRPIETHAFTIKQASQPSRDEHVFQTMVLPNMMIETDRFPFHVSAFLLLTYGFSQYKGTRLEKHSLFQAVSSSLSHSQGLDANTCLQSTWANTLTPNDPFLK